MDQIQREKVLEKLGKIKALAERGVGGEKETALRMYEELCRKYDISEDEAEAALAQLEKRWFSYSTQLEESVPDTKLYRSGERSTFKEDTVSGTITAGQEKVRGGTSLVVQGCGAYRLDGYGGYKEGVGTLRATGGNNGGGSETLITEKRKGKEILKHIVRRLTPLECERLDGFPDGWTQERKDGRGISDNARYTALGNSIAVPCAVRVFRGIMAVEAEVAGNADNDNQ